MIIDLDVPTPNSFVLTIPGDNSTQDVDITGPPSSNFVFTYAGPQGPKGDQNVYTGPTPPASPKVGWVWIEVPV